LSQVDSLDQIFETIEPPAFTDLAAGDWSMLDEIEQDPQWVQEEYGILNNIAPRSEEERVWDVYGGYARPQSDDDWRRICQYCIECLYLATGVMHEFREWEETWDFPLDLY
jgi:hypothetical protein